MAFHEVQFPSDISLGAEASIQRRTDIIALASGFEERNTPWAQSRRRYNAGYGVKSLDDIDAVIAFFEARQGPLHGFRWRDPFDFKSSAPSAAVTPLDQQIGTGDGATAAFQLAKTYQSGAETQARVIKKPVSGSVRIAIDGVEAADGVDFTVDATTGVVTFQSGAIPAGGAAVTAGYEFDTPVRFDTQELSFSRAAFLAGDAPNIPLIEIRLP
ncbi:MAG: DUF2460 domain-containing protein [Parvularculaceae bacterium]